MLKRLYKNVSIKAYIYSIFHAIVFFTRVMAYRGLYRVTSNIETMDIEEFNYQIAKYIIALIVCEMFHGITYIGAKKSLNEIIMKIINKSLASIITSAPHDTEKYDRSILNSVYDTHYVLETLYEKLILNLPRYIIYLVYYLYTITKFSFKVTLLMLIVSIISSFIVNYVSKFKDRNYNEMYSVDTQIKLENIERINNLKHIKMSNEEYNEMRMLNDSIVNRIKLKNSDTYYSFITSIIPEVTGILMTCAVYMIGSVQMKQNNLSSIDVIFLGTNTNNFVFFVIGIVNIYFEYIKHKKQIGILYDISRFVPEKEKHKPINLSKPTNVINNTINTNYQIVHKSNNRFNIKSNAVTAIIGANGIGKTTMIYSILGLNDINDWIFMSHDNVINQIELRKYVGIVFQDPYIFDRSIEENVKYGLDITDDTIIELNIKTLSIQLGINEFYEKNAKRNAGIQGQNLSGGEKKKIQLMNSLLQNKQIYVFDEPTNNLDQNTKKWYIDQIKKLAETKTIIVITHDNDMINNADDVINLSSVLGNSA